MGSGGPGSLPHTALTMRMTSPLEVARQLVLQPGGESLFTYQNHLSAHTCHQSHRTGCC